MVTVGAVLSIFTAGEVIDAVFPAPSVAVTVPVVAAPSADRTNGLGVLLPAFTPLGSSIVNARDTSVLFHPWTFGPGTGVSNTTLGACASMTHEKDCIDGLPALSVAITVKV